jgi:hypothetical protein
MCAPALAIASAAISIAQAGAQYAAQKSQADQQAARNLLQQQFIEQNRVSEINQAQQQIVYHNDEAFQQLQDATRRNQQASATAIASAADNGVQGVSVGALAQEYDARYGEFQSDVVANRDANVEQLQQQMLSFNNQALSADNQLRPPVYPSLIATGLQIGAAAFNAYDKYQKAQPPSGGTGGS